MHVYVAVEGLLDEAVVKRLLADVGVDDLYVFGRKGKSHLLRQLKNYNQAAHYDPWLVLLDLNGDSDCAPNALSKWLPDPAPRICLRIAVREIESWLLADHERMAKKLGISRARLPRAPDDEADPKRTVVRLATGSRRREIRQGVARGGKGDHRIGPLYNAMLSEFVRDRTKGWRPEVAAERSPSLARSLAAIRRFADSFG